MSADRRLLVALFAVALGARVLYGVLADAYLGVGPALTTPDLVYAQKIVSSFDWITNPYSARSPGYPVLLGTIYLIAFKQVWIAFFLQAALSAFTAVALYWTAAPLIGRRLAVAAALWLSLYVLHLHYTSLFVRDVSVTLFLLLVVSILIRPLQRMRLAAVAGALYAALIHVDPQFLLIAPVLAFLVLFKSRHRILSLQYLFVFAGVTLVLALPWTIRNQFVYRQPIPVGLEATRYLRPLKIFVVDAEKTITSIQQRAVSASRTRRIENNSAEFWRVARFRDSAATEAKAEPQSGIEPSWSLRHNLVSIGTYGLLLPFLILGTVVAIRNRERAALMIALMIVTYFIMRAWLGGNERARLPVDPLIILLAFYGINSVVAWLARRRSAQAVES